MTRRHRNAASGRFAAARDADADPERHVAEAVKPAFCVSIVDISPHFTKLNLHGTGMSVHRFTGADGPDCLPHDHPFRMEIEIIRGGYVEEVFDLENPAAAPQRVERKQGDRFVNQAATIHRVLHLTAPEVWTQVWLGEPEREAGEYQFRDGMVFHRLFRQPEFTRIA